MATEQSPAIDEPAQPEMRENDADRPAEKRTWQDSVAAVDPDHHVHQRQRTDSPASSVVTRPAAFLSRRVQQQQQPRWHNQSYMIFLALRQHEDRCLPRTALIKAALELDKKISQERHLPKVFRGKTPMNSASAILTNNSDRYFIPFKPPNSRSTHFKLAYEPGNFKRAVQEYRKWETMLAEHDWPFCFGELKPGVKPPSPSLPPSKPSEPEFESKTDGGPKIADSEIPVLAQPTELKEKFETINAMNVDSAGKDTLFPTTIVETKEQDNVNGVDIDMGTEMDKAVQEEVEMSEATKDKDIPGDKETSEAKPDYNVQNEKIEEEGVNGKIATCEDVKDSVDKGGFIKKGSTEEHTEWAPTLDQLDLSNVPKSWKDIVRVGESKIPGAGQGLFAARRLPNNIPLGFYFGVPMTEDEYDHLKDNVGRASEYSIMYRKTVLDATNDDGQPYTDPDGELFCPFHFMNETDEKGANISFIEGSVVNQVICWAKRAIEEGEELLVWYGRDVDRHWKQPV